MINLMGELKEANYPKGIGELCSDLDSAAVYANGQDICYVTTIHNKTLLKHWKLLKEDKTRLAAPGIRQEMINRRFAADNPGFHGMNADEYLCELEGTTRKHIDLLDNARKELERTGLVQALEENMIGLKKRRKRCFSEHDGNFELDRRYEIEPFSSVKFSKKEFPYLELIIPIGMNASAKADTINQFTSRCLALADILEKAGYRVSLVAESWGENSTVICDKDRARGKALGIEYLRRSKDIDRIVLRDANEYGDIESVANSCNASFFRMVTFPLFFEVRHYLQAKSNLSASVPSSYGQALDSRPLPVSGGAIVLDQNTIAGIFSMNSETRERMFKERILHTVGLGAA